MEGYYFVQSIHRQLCRVCYVNYIDRPLDILLYSLKFIMDSVLDTLRLRPHHLFCRRYQLDDEPDTDDEFGIFGRKIREILRSGTKTLVIVTEGVDDLCAICSHNRNGRCENPHGDEEKTRKWDSILLDNLGISYGCHFTPKRYVRLQMKKLHFRSVLISAN
jgi:hypothetical protein